MCHTRFFPIHSILYSLSMKVYGIPPLCRGKNMYRENREMHTVTCADCGKETQVPFKPDGSRPVYCRECFQKHKPKRF